MFKRAVQITLAAALTAGWVAAVTGPADAATKPKVYANCTALNKDFKHGVGREGAADKVAKGAKPVTTFTVNTAVYNANKVKLDRDKDGIACEKK